MTRVATLTAAADYPLYKPQATPVTFYTSAIIHDTLTAPLY